jgi:hypothetical protein
MILTSFSHIDKAILNMRHGSICRAADSDCFLSLLTAPAKPSVGATCRSLKRLTLKYFTNILK